jgi:tetratricopeptide (TPR) repeat protein
MIRIALGRALFKSKTYYQAMHCFEKASLPIEANICRAYHMREELRKRSSSFRKSNSSREDFASLAHRFLQCANDARHNNQTYFRIAGECYEESGDLLNAAQAYISAEEYSKSAKLYRTAGKFDEAVAVVDKYRSSMDVPTVEAIIDVARLHYFKSIGDTQPDSVDLHENLQSVFVAVFDAMLKKIYQES